MHPRLRNLLLTTAALLALGAAPAAGGPEGGTVVGGAATIQGQGGPAVTVNQSSSSAIMNWNTFNIGVNESVRFNQPGASSVVLNRVTGGLGPSEILGTLTANGRVFVINRDGILFGPGSVVNTAGFLATTHDIKNSDFMAGRYNFNIPGRPDASIVNQGWITATSGGFAALVAPGVRNTGTITATLGTVALVSGNGFTLDLYGDKLITLAVNDQIASKVIDVATGRPLKSLVSNEGKIRANGGPVELTAAAARTVVDSVINTSGGVKAHSIGHHNALNERAGAPAASKPPGASTPPPPSTPRRGDAATAARSFYGRTARPPSPEPFSPAAARKVATAASWRHRATSCSITAVRPIRGRQRVQWARCCLTPRTSTSTRKGFHPIPIRRPRPSRRTLWSISWLRTTWCFRRSHQERMRVTSSSTPTSAGGP